MPEPLTGPDRYLHDLTELLYGDSVVEIDPQDPESLAAFVDAAREQREHGWNPPA